MIYKFRYVIQNQVTNFPLIVINMHGCMRENASLDNGATNSNNYHSFKNRFNGNNTHTGDYHISTAYGYQ